MHLEISSVLHLKIGSVQYFISKYDKLKVSHLRVKEHLSCQQNKDFLISEAPL